MKIYIGPYTNWFGPHQLCDYLKYLGVSEKNRDKIAEYLPIGVFNWLDSFKDRKVKIRIDEYDTCGMDHTLAMIILPMLKQLKETKHGSPLVDDEDVPEHIKSTNAPPVENEWDSDEHFYARWDWVLDEMIWAFENIVDEESDEQFYSGQSDFIFDDLKVVEGPNHTLKVDKEGLKKHHERVRNGTRLFGKYFQNLWD